jgi:hypothetical protein
MTRKLTKIDSMADRASSWSAPVRELAQRLSGTAEILLVWYPGVDRVELAVSDVTTGERIQIEVAPENAMDAFNHPYAYVAPARAFTT